VNKPRKIVSLLLLFAGYFGVVSPLYAQSDNSTTKPYATLDRQAVTYRGPVAAGQFSPGENAVIGAMLPLHGPEQAEGQALLAALQVAVDQELARGALPDGRKLLLVARDESGPWGQASSEILKLIDQDHAVVVLTSANGSIAHQAEQIANKISFPILTLASDPTTTQTNVPWVFRIAPSDTDQAHAFARRIYTELKLQKVLLVAQTDHDGRNGRAEFEKAARELRAPAPDVVELATPAASSEALAGAIAQHSPDSVVLWTDAIAAQELVSTIRANRPRIPIFLSTKAAQLSTQSLSASLCIAAVREDQKLGEEFTVVSLPTQADVMRDDFAREYHARAGEPPSIAAFQAYEAIRLVIAGLRSAGVNRVLLRDYLANDGTFRAALPVVPFDPAGNDTDEFTIVTIAEPAARHTAR
jgi:ABC-type branched-subunit amino acid transport system substrate-binding protein